MNFIKLYQLPTLILLGIFGPTRICGVTIGSQPANCDIKPTGVNKVDVLVYVNGDTEEDKIWYNRYCSWKDAEISPFPFDQYAPVTVKIGGKITCDNNNKCSCPNNDGDSEDCANTFKLVCAEQILGQEKFKDLMCCADLASEGFQECIKKQSGLAQEIKTCMSKRGPGSPQEIALKNAKEAADKGVNTTHDKEPFFFYNRIYDKCISEDSFAWFVHKICLMLNNDTAKSVEACVYAMGW